MKVQGIVQRIDSLSTGIGKFSSYIILITVAATVIEVIARYVFASPTIWAYEVEIFTCGTVYVLIGAHCQRIKSHVSVDLVYRMFNPKFQRLLRMTVNFPLILIFSVALTYMGTQYAWTSIQMGEKTYSAWAPYVWPVKMMLPIGGFLLTLQAISDFLRDLFLPE